MRKLFLLLCLIAVNTYSKNIEPVKLPKTEKRLRETINNKFFISNDEILTLMKEDLKFGLVWSVDSYLRTEGKPMIDDIFVTEGYELYISSTLKAVKLIKKCR